MGDEAERPGVFSESVDLMISTCMSTGYFSLFLPS